jgi:dTDP-4-dehydrorhamnose 3,5-epimerase-like enzyme
MGVGGKMARGIHTVELPKITDSRGNLTFIESEGHVPFTINRVYYLYDVPGGEGRGGHAHKTCQGFIIAASGSFTVKLHDGKDEQTIFMNRAYYGLYIPNMIWRELHDFSSGAVCLVLASKHYDPDDYIRDFDEFMKFV